MEVVQLTLLCARVQINPPESTGTLTAFNRRRTAQASPNPSFHFDVGPTFHNRAVLPVGRTNSHSKQAFTKVDGSLTVQHLTELHCTIIMQQNCARLCARSSAQEIVIMKLDAHHSANTMCSNGLFSYSRSPVHFDRIFKLSASSCTNALSKRRSIPHISDLGAHEFSELESRAVGPTPCRTSLPDGGWIW